MEHDLCECPWCEGSLKTPAELLQSVKELLLTTEKGLGR